MSLGGFLLRGWLILAGGLALAAAAGAEEVRLSSGAALSLQGLGLAQELRQDYYLGALYAPAGAALSDSLKDPNRPRRMSLKLLAERIPARAFQRYWKERIALNNPREAWVAQTATLVRFAALFSQPLTKGDRIDFDYLPGEGTLVWLNGQRLDLIPSASFHGLLLSAWLGDLPPSEAFKTQLLAGADPALASRYEAMPAKVPAQPVLAQAPLPEAKPAAPAPVKPAASKPVPATPVDAKPVLAKADKPQAGKLQTDKLQAAKPKDKPLPPKPVPAPAVVEIKVQAAAPSAPKPQAEPAPAPAAENPVQAAVAPDADLLLGAYKRDMLQHIRKNLRYPPRAWRLGLSGSGIVGLRILPDGSAEDISVLQSSGQMLLDEAMKSMVEASLPLPKPPQGVDAEALRLEVPVDFVR